MNVENELLRRKLALTSLDDYANYMAPSGHLDFAHPPAKHHRVMTRALDELLLPIDDPMHPKDANGVPITKLLVTAPPGSAKSTYFSVQFATYYLARHPDHHILCSSNVSDLAQAFNRRRRSACYTQEWQNLAETTLDPEAKGIEHFFTERGGSVKAAGVGATIVGIRSNLNILDDPIESWEQALSQVQLMKIWDWYETEYRTRMYGVPDALEVLMHQRWNRNDPAGIILDKIEKGDETGWKVINIPLEAYWAADEPDPIWREPGEILWPENKSFHEIPVDKLKKNKAKWAALSQQRPLDEKGGWVGEEHIQMLPVRDWERMKLDHKYRYIGTGDLALSESRGDGTWLQVWAITPDRDLILCDAVHHQKSVEDTVTALYRLQAIYKCMSWLLDDDPATKVFHRLVLEHARTQTASPAPIELMPLRGHDKEVRATAIKGYFRAGRVWIVDDPLWSPQAIHEILAFPGEPDDFVDAAGLMGRKMVQLNGYPDDKPKVDKPIQGLITEREGQQYLSMNLNTLFEQREREMSTWRSQRIRLG